MTPTGICTSSPLLLTSITGSRTTWSMCCSPACGAFRMARSASTRNNVTPGASSSNESLKTLLGGLERGLVGTLTTIGSITEDQGAQ